ncbi:MAG: Cof-type HAD-IIB family hydrolase [Bacilli bacterium]|nr:Cof-type HAD-IIB family hydrolase [Bacilli bacterium]MBO6286906.1 Cof-type HAD-IIB family hydrolase [Bacilli bacterium]
MKNVSEPKDIKIVFTDIDGTLFSHVTNSVPQTAIAAIHLLQAKGIKVFLCSGRNYYLIRKSGILNLIHPDGLVMMNGSSAEVDGKIIYRYPIPETVVDKIILFAKKLKFGLTLIEENEGHINMIDDRVISAHEKYGTRFPQPRHFPDHYDRVVYQMIAFCDEIEESLFLPHLENCKSARWDEYAVDIMPEDSDKFKGIKSVLDYFGWGPENAMALGDGNNDREMLANCGIGVAMAKATEAAKKAADYVTDDIDENGWYNAMRHFNLIG